MKMVYITFHSITPAQRGQRLLRSQGLESSLQRTPRWMEERGCSYCLRVRQEAVEPALALLREGDLAFSKVYAEENSVVTEMRL